MTLRTTRTYALLELSAAAYDEISTKLAAAGYGHAFGPDGEIDMHGIAVVLEPPKRSKVYDLRGFLMAADST